MSQYINKSVAKWRFSFIQSLFTVRCKASKISILYIGSILNERCTYKIGSENAIQNHIQELSKIKKWCSLWPRNCWSYNSLVELGKFRITRDGGKYILGLLKNQAPIGWYRQIGCHSNTPRMQYTLNSSHGYFAHR